MKRLALVGIAAIVAGLCLAADPAKTSASKSGTSTTAASGPTILTFTEADSGKDFTVQVGTKIVVRLAGSDANTGWEAFESKPLTEILKSAGGGFNVAPTSPDAAIGTYIFNYQAVKEGKATLEFRYIRPGGPGVVNRDKSVVVKKVTIGIEVVPAGRSASGPTTLTAAQEKAAQELIAKLADSDFAFREAATNKLIEMGQATHPLLKAKLAEKGLDPEAANRIALVLKKTTLTEPAGRSATDEATGITVTLSDDGRKVSASKDGKVIWMMSWDGLKAETVAIMDGQVLLRPSGILLDLASGKMMARAKAVPQ